MYPSLQLPLACTSAQGGPSSKDTPLERGRTSLQAQAFEEEEAEEEGVEEEPVSALATDAPSRARERATQSSPRRDLKENGMESVVVMLLRWESFERAKKKGERVKKGEARKVFFFFFFFFLLTRIFVSQKEFPAAAASSLRHYHHHQSRAAGMFFVL